jgi:carboxyl-terminal processing protease
MIKNKKFSPKTRKIVAGTLLTILLFVGVSYSPDYFEISKNLEIFNAVYRELNVSYVDGTKPGQLMKTGIDAMLNSLDPYTVYYAENDIEDYRFMTTGEYGGIGATVVDMDGKIVVSDPYEGFAAFKAGIRAGDQILEINNINVVGKKTDDIGSLLKGAAGTQLNMKVLKPGQKDAVLISLNREEIKTKAVPYSGLLPNSQTGYIKLVSFTENCSGAVKEALTELKGKGCKSLILDLRGNPGGLLQEAVKIVNFFVDRGQEVVFTKGKVQEWDHSYVAESAPFDMQIPLVVLVDESSASASEIVSGALQDLDRAVIVGKRTYGKGLVQQTKQLVYNAQIKVTVAKYYIPSGRCVQALDYSSRDEDGRVEKVPDSLITAFKTRGGRIVYDGAGIMPDVKTPEEKFEDILLSLISKHHIFNYATTYALKHKTIAPVGEFALTDGEYADFINYLKDKEYNYKTREEMELEEFKKNVEGAKGFDAIKPEYEALANRLKSNKKDDLEENKPLIKKYLEEEIASRYYYQTGRIEYGLKHDADLEEAGKIIADANRVKNILTTIEKPTKPFNLKKKF